MEYLNILKSFFAGGPYGQILKDIHKIAKSSTNFIIWGESGTGKNLIAYLSHALSQKAQWPYIEVDCSSLPETLIETELFGYTRGAFTGAEKDHPGRISLAHKGTLVLDNIDNLSIRAQAKLLKEIENRKYTPMGSHIEKSLDTNFIAIMQTNPVHLMEIGLLRKDLYYRISVFSVKTPSLKESREILNDLIDFISDKEAERANLPRTSFSKEARNFLTNYDFPGNVRELKNFIRKWTLLFPGKVLSLQDVKNDIGFAHSTQHFETLDEIEKKHIQRVLKYTGGHIGQAAKILGIHRKTLLEKRKKYCLDKFRTEEK